MRTATGLMAIMLIAVGMTMSVKAQTPLQAQLVARPLTPGDIVTYGLPADTEVSGGLTTVGVGQPAYLEADLNHAVPASDIVSVSWLLVSKPTGSLAAFLPSPLGTNVPVFEPADQLVYQVGGRAFLRPDVAGQYTVSATIATASEGTTNLTLKITAGTYMGFYTCALCHSGGQIADDKVTPWLQTTHAPFFAQAIDGQSSVTAMPVPARATVGYDTNTNTASDGGFNWVAMQLGWTLPTVLTNGNWTSMQTNYPSLVNLANIQCENCHGPGSQHATLLGDTTSSNWPSVAVSYSSGDCAQCHDNPPNDTKFAEWEVSAHAVTTTDPAGNASCVVCHTGKGFIARIEGAPITDTSYDPIGCQTCHDPHGETLQATNAPNPDLLRTMASVTLADGTVVTNAGEGTLCMQCHHARQNAAVYAANTPGSAYFGPHEGPQADMLEGVNGFTYGQTIPSSAHANVVSNTCVTCHMQSVDPASPAYGHAGSHTFKVMCDPGGDGVILNMVAACQQCHGSEFTATSGWNVPVQDYDGDGVIEGVQDEVQNLLNKLSTLLPPDNTVKSSLSIDPTWTTPQLEAAYNWLFVNNDHSLGAHNIAYTVGLLKASIANLTGASVPGGLPDAWVTNYFGSINNPAAALDAVNNASGIPNWMMYALGLNPTASFQVTNGVIYFNGNNIVNGTTNTITIYRAAEIAFDTQVGVNYQIQGISQLSGGWQNISTNIPGTGGSISYLTPTRNNAQMFFRVGHTP